MFTIFKRARVGLCFSAMALLAWAASGQPQSDSSSKSAAPVPPQPVQNPAPGGKTPGGPVSPSSEKVGVTVESPERSAENPPPDEGFPTPKMINDPIERFDRGMFVFNDGLITYVISPLESGYKIIAPEPVRTHVKQCGYNLAFPDRLVNTLLQGKFHGAGVETGRFLVNTTIGIVGIFDPATKMGMGNYNEDFGQTFGHYGAGPGFYLFIPFMGPSSLRDGVGLIGDSVLDFSNVLTGLGFLFKFNDMSFRVREYQGLKQTQVDPYVVMRDFWAADREMNVRDFEIPPGEHDAAPTVRAIFLSPSDPKFPDRGKRAAAETPTTGRKLPYTYWMQKEPAPLVFVLPGVGGNRYSESALAVAEKLYAHGFSAVTVSNALNWEFMEKAASETVPGYPVVDAHDIYVGLNATYQQLKQKYPDRITSTALLGLSLGALHTLFISNMDGAESPNDIKFDRYVAVNPPVDLPFALKKLDDFYDAPLRWKPEERQDRIMTALMKAAKLTEEKPDPNGELPLDRNESEFLIGLSFRMTLRDLIYESQRRKNLGILKSSFSRFKRQPLYDEIAQYSYTDYLEEFVIPYYAQYANHRVDRDEMTRKSSLSAIEEQLKQNPNMRIFVNQNDFLLKSEDIERLKQLMGDRLTIFSQGGHLGNLYLPEVQEKIISALTDLKSRTVK